MRRPFALLFLPFLVLAPLSAERPEKEEIDAWIEQLADEKYQTRQLATHRLWELGNAALPALRQAVESDDPERAHRAGNLVFKIELAITPDTPPEVVSIVERYGTARVDVKMNFMHELHRRGAWRQMLQLHANETDEDARHRLKGTIERVALTAARERLSAGDAEGAREFLELAPKNASTFMVLAAFHRNQGTLDAAGERMKSSEHHEAWKLAVHRTTGEIAKARQQANQIGEPWIAASMAMLAGDPLPWLKQSNDRHHSRNDNNPATELAIKRWNTGNLRPPDLEPLVARMTAPRDESLRRSGTNALFYLGEVDLAKVAFIKSQPLLAFAHYDLLEQLDDAHKAVGLDPAEPDYQAWLSKRLSSLLKDPDEDDSDFSTEIGELNAMANFLERRGLHAELEAAFLKPMAELAEENPSRFSDFLSQLFGTPATMPGAPRLALAITRQWAGDDPVRWSDARIAAFGEDAEYRSWWEWLEVVKPDSTHAERLAAMLVLFGYDKDTENIRDEWLDAVWKSVDEAPEKEKSTISQRIIFLADQIRDVKTSMKVRHMIPLDERHEYQENMELLYLSALERWNETAEICLRQIGRDSDAGRVPRPEKHAFAAASLRLAGRNEEAKAHDSWVEKLALGESATSLQIGHGYAFGRDYQRAGQWYERAVREADPDSGNFISVLEKHAENLLEESRWKEAAASLEVLAALEHSGESMPHDMMSRRLQADLARAISTLSENRARAITLLEKSHAMFPGTGSLADHFFPALRQAGLIEEHDKWFEQSWKGIHAVLARYPESDNTMNTAAWLAARSLKRLDEAEALLEKALEIHPRQPAYLDTMAEIAFAKKNRKKAIDWSELAINYHPGESMIRRQNARFRTGSFPK